MEKNTEKPGLSGFKPFLIVLAALIVLLVIIKFALSALSI
jgi:hypothetical protein